jgi:hypothetical protein
LSFLESATFCRIGLVTHEMYEFAAEILGIMVHHAPPARTAQRRDGADLAQVGRMSHCILLACH